MVKKDELSGTIRRVDNTNSDYFSSSAPATAYPPRATRSATFPLPPPPHIPLSRPRARTGNAPLSGIQVDPRARDFSNHGNRSIDRSFIPRPLFEPVALFQSSQLNKVGGRTEIQTLGKSMVLCTLWWRNPLELALAPTKIKDQAYLYFLTTEHQIHSCPQK